jgi:hypothetical protein
MWGYPEKIILDVRVGVAYEAEISEVFAPPVE